MRSVFALKKEKIEAEQAAIQAADSGEPINAPIFDQMMLRLQNFKNLISKLANRGFKTARKRAAIPEFNGYIDGILAAGEGGQDDVFMTIFMWICDTGDYIRATELFEHADEHKLSMPMGFKRSPINFFAESMAKYYLDENSDFDPKTAISHLQELEVFMIDADVHEDVKALVFKSLGSLLVSMDDEKDKLSALEYLKKAQGENPKSGLKTKINSLQKALKLKK